MESKKICFGVLYSDNIKNLVSKEAIQSSIKSISNIISSIECINADTLNESDLSSVQILINTLGSYYPENNWAALLKFYEKGGIVLNVGAKPFTIPYSTSNGTLRIFNETERALHSLHLVDEYAPTNSLEDDLVVKVLSPKYSFIEDLKLKGFLPKMKESYSSLYQLSDRTLEASHWLDGMAIKCGELEVAAGWYDETGRLLAAPISRVDYYEKGSMMFLNFTPEDDYYNSNQGMEFLAGILESLAVGRFKFLIKPELPRYTETETPALTYSLEKLPGPIRETEDYSLRLRLFDLDRKQKIREYCFNLQLDGNKAEGRVVLDNLPESFYKVSALLCIEGKGIKEIETGFYKVSENYISKLLSSYNPITIDKSISTDFCTREGKPFLMHGVNYHVTDSYRMCFIDFNPYQCHLDFEYLTSAGMNILRTGNWQCYDLFYDNQGKIRDNIFRNLEAFYLTAAKHNLAAQFVLGAFIMNHWDRSKCPVHNPEMRLKTITAFKSFADHFAGWPNVQIDAINEPSYSIKGAWNLAKPSEDPYERLHWIEWLKDRYGNDIEALRDNWGVNSSDISSFEEAELPTDHNRYQRGYDRQDSNPDGALHDFYEFAFESYSCWVSDLKEAVQSSGKEILFMMGRDESLRVPAQQYEAHKGNLDIVNFHQWHKDAFIFSEYLFNKVRGIPCCGQEIGTYHFGTQRNDTRLTETDCAEILERKLLYSFGNWIQWQAYNDPYMIDSIERALGLIRADRTEGPNMQVARLLAWIEENTRSLHFNRDEDVVRTAILFPTSEYFSVDSGIAFNGMMKTIKVFFERLKLQADIVLENLFISENKHQIGDPNLIIMPASMCISSSAWEQMLKYAHCGKTILISGITDMDEYWNKADRLHKLGVRAKTQNIKSVEKIRIGEKEFVASFRESLNYYLPAAALSKVAFEDSCENTVKEIPVGKGRFLICPLPLELSSNEEAIMELYAYAASRANADNRLFTMDNYSHNLNLVIYPMVYENSTVYTIVNEGCDDSLSFTDVRSNQNITISVKGQRGAKLWISPQGELQAAYLNGDVRIGNTTIGCSGSLSIAQAEGGYKLLSGDGVGKVLIIRNGISSVLKVVPFNETLIEI